MSQTTVSAAGQAIGIAGQIADTGPLQDPVSGFNMESTLQIPFGFGVRGQPGVADGYLLPTGFSNVGGDVAGVNVFSFNHQRVGVADSAGNFAGDMGASGLLPKAGMQILRHGRVLVPVEANVRPDDRAYCRGIPTGALTAGIWAGSGYGASYHIDCTKQAVFRSSTFTAADGTTKVAILEVDFTNKP